LDGITVSAPSNWQGYTFASQQVASPAGISTVGYISNQSLQDPCATITTSTGTDYGCGSPLPQALMPGDGVLITVVAGALPNLSGRPYQPPAGSRREVVDGFAVWVATTDDDATECPAGRGSREITSIFVDPHDADAQPVLTFQACLGPTDLAADEAAVARMVSGARVDATWG
jgi:hypothetical protein